MTDPNELRASFNQAAREYDAIRPGYPPELIEEIVRLTPVPPGGQLLEVGCGTGQATLPFAQRGYNLLALDIGAELLAVAAEKLRDYPNVRFEKYAFEDWPEEGHAFDLVYSATAFHWVPREVGFPKAARILKPGGALAVFSNLHPGPYTGFFEEVQSVYSQFEPVMGRKPGRMSVEDEIRATAAYVDSTGLFEPVIVRTYPWTRTYTTLEYLRLLNTYSDHLTLEEGRRQSLYQGIADLIERRYGGKVERHYLSVLFLSAKARSMSFKR